METARNLNARLALTTAVVAARAARLTVTTMQVNGGELMTRVHRGANGRILRHSHTFQGRRIDRATALRLATQAKARH